jgi:hypothetical protein
VRRNFRTRLYTAPAVIALHNNINLTPIEIRQKSTNSLFQHDITASDTCLRRQCRRRSVYPKIVASNALTFNSRPSYSLQYLNTLAHPSVHIYLYTDKISQAYAMETGSKPKLSVAPQHRQCFGLMSWSSHMITFSPVRRCSVGGGGGSPVRWPGNCQSRIPSGVRADNK